MPVWMDKFYRDPVTPLNKLFGLCLLYCCSSFAVAATSPLPAFKAQPYSAEYYAYHSGSKLGKAQQALRELEDGNYQLYYTSKLRILFISDKREENSIFKWQNDKIIPIRYKYRRTGTTGSDKSLDVEFDAENKLIKIAPDKTLPWKGELDNQLYSLDVRKMLAMGETTAKYQMINSRGQQREYGIQVLGTETLQLPYGTVDTIKTKIIRSSKKRETFIWFAPELDYVMVRLQQFKQGKEQGDIKLSKYQPDSPATAKAGK